MVRDAKLKRRWIIGKPYSQNLRKRIVASVERVTPTARHRMHRIKCKPL